jgi:hypothetical protein
MALLPPIGKQKEVVTLTPESHAVVYLAKPFSFDELLAWMASASPTPGSQTRPSVAVAGARTGMLARPLVGAELQPVILRGAADRETPVDLRRDSQRRVPRTCSRCLRVTSGTVEAGIDLGRNLPKAGAEI